MILSNFSVLLGPLVCSKLVQGLERWLHSSEHWFLLQRTRVQYLVPTQWLTTIYIKLQFQGESDAFCGLHGDCTYCAQTYIQAEYATGEIKINKISRKKIEQKYVGRRGCEGSIWIRAYPLGISLRFPFLIPHFVSEQSNRCVGRETQSRRAKATSSFCLTLWLDWHCEHRPLACALEQPSPAVLALGCTQLFSRCLAQLPVVMPSPDWLLAGESKDNIPKAHWAVLWRLLQAG